jgi:hypothetical protein
MHSGIGVPSASPPRLCLIILFVGSLAQGTAAGQSTAAGLSGTVYDEEHAVLPGASVTLCNVETGRIRTTVADKTGSFHLVGLEPGQYELAIELVGFRTHVSTGITLSIGEEGHIEPTMVIAALTETVSVVSENLPLVETSRSALGRTITTKEIEGLPVAGRDFTNLGFLTPGILTDHSTVSGGSGIVTAAQSGRDNFAANDGLSVIGTQSSTPLYGVPLDAIKEFVVLTNGFSAEIGQASGGVVNVLTRSGNNELFGWAFYYHRDDAWDATAAAARLVVPPLAKSKLEQK